MKQSRFRRFIQLSVVTGVVAVMAMASCLSAVPAFADPGPVQVVVKLANGTTYESQTCDYAWFTSLPSETNWYSSFCGFYGGYRYWEAQGPTMATVLANLNPSISTSELSTVDAVYYNLEHNSYQVCDTGQVNWVIGTPGDAYPSGYGFTPGYYYSSTGRSQYGGVAVDPILATQVREQDTFINQTAWQDADCIRSFIGQPAYTSSYPTPWHQMTMRLDNTCVETITFTLNHN